MTPKAGKSFVRDNHFPISNTKVLGSGSQDKKSGDENNIINRYENYIFLVLICHFN